MHIYISIYSYIHAHIYIYTLRCFRGDRRSTRGAWPWGCPDSWAAPLPSSTALLELTKTLVNFEGPASARPAHHQPSDLDQIVWFNYLDSYNKPCWKLINSRFNCIRNGLLGPLSRERNKMTMMALGGVPREQKMLKGHLPGVIYPRVY